MAEVVGTAFVRIRAITKDLAKDMQSGIDKGVADAHLDRVGNSAGDEFGTAMSHSAGAAVKDELGDVVTNAVTDSDAEGAGTNVGERLGKATKSAFKKEAEKGFFDKIIDDKQKKKFSKDIESIFSDIGGSLGGAGGKALAGAVASPLVADALQTLSQTVITIVGQIGFIGQAFVGAGAAGAAAFSAVAIAALPVFLAFKSNSPRLEAFKKQMSKLNDEFQLIGRATQRTLLPALTQAAKKMTKLIQPLADFGRDVGKIVGDLAKRLSTAITGKDGIGRINKILDASRRILITFSNAVFDVGDALSAMFVSALPAGENFAKAIGGIVGGFNDMIQRVSASGALTGFFDIMFLRAQKLFGALGNIVIGLIHILNIGGTTSVPLFDTFDAWAERFRKFTESAAGKNRIKQIFDTALPVAKALGDIVLTLADLLFGATFDPKGTKGIVGALNKINDFLPVIFGGLGDFINKMRQPLSNLGQALGDFLAAFDAVGGLALTIDVFTKLTEALTALLKVPGFAEFIANIAAVTAVFGLLKALGITSTIEAITSGLIALGGVVSQALLGLEATGAAAFSIGAEFVAIAGVVAVAVVKLKPVFATLVAIIAGVGGVLVAIFASGPIVIIAAAAAIGAAIGAIIRNFDTLKNAVFAVGRFFQDMGPRIDAAKKNLGQFASTIKDTVVAGLGKLVDGLSKAGNALKNIGAAIVKGIGRGLANLGKALAGLAKDAAVAFVDELLKLPGQLARLSVTLLKALLGLFVDVVTGVIKAIPKLLLGIVTAFVALPFLILQGLRNIGILLIDLFLGALVLLAKALIFGIPKIIEAWQAIISAIIKFVAAQLPAIIDFFTKLPGRIKDAITGLAQLLLDAFVAALSGIYNFLQTNGPKVLEFFRTLPGKIIGFIKDLPANAKKVFSDAIGAIATALTVFITQTLPSFGSQLLAAGKNLIGSLISGLGSAIKGSANIAKDIVNGIIGFINKNIIDKINSLLQFDIGGKFGVPKVHISGPHIPDIAKIGLAFGGIVTQPVTARIGEAGSSEAVIPLNDRGIAALSRAIEKAGLTQPATQQPVIVQAGETLQQFITSSDPILTATEATRQHRAARVALTRKS